MTERHAHADNGFFNGGLMDIRATVTEQARDSVKSRVLGHPNGGTDVVDMLGLGDL